MLLYVIRGSSSVVGPYIRRGAHPPPHRHRPRVLAKLTHNHATGFPWRPCRGSLSGRPLMRNPTSIRWFDSTVPIMLHTTHSCMSLVKYNVNYLLSFSYVTWGGHCCGEGCENSVPLWYVCAGGIQGGELERVAGFGKYISHPTEDIYQLSGNARYLIQMPWN